LVLTENPPRNYFDRGFFAYGKDVDAPLVFNVVLIEPEIPLNAGPIKGQQVSSAEARG